MRKRRSRRRNMTNKRRNRRRQSRSNTSGRQKRGRRHRRGIEGGKRKKRRRRSREESRVEEGAETGREVEEEERGREENPESGRGNKREVGDRTAEADDPTEPPPTIRNWSIPEVAKEEGLIPTLEESHGSLTKSLPCIDLALRGSVTDNGECTMRGGVAVDEYSQAPTPEDRVWPPIMWGCGPPSPRVTPFS